MIMVIFISGLNKTKKNKVFKLLQIQNLIQINKNYSFNDFTKIKNTNKDNNLKISSNLNFNNNSLRVVHLNQNSLHRLKKAKKFFEVQANLKTCPT